VQRALSSQPTVSIVIPARNGEATIAPCIEAVLAADYPPERREVIVVDNASTDRTPELASRHPVRVIREPRPGVSRARNAGAAAARSEILVFLDADCIVEPTWLAELVAPFADPDVGCVAGGLEHLPPSTAAERQAVRMLGDWQSFAVSSDPPYVVTANAAFRRTAFDAVGGFDPRMRRAQDVDIGLRLHARTDLRVAHAPAAIARHRHHASQRGFFRQQLGWAYGAGLVGAKYRHLPERRPDPPRARNIARNIAGLAQTILLRLRGRGRAEWVEEAWFGLLHQIAWWAGGWAGLIHGRLIWR